MIRMPWHVTHTVCVSLQATTIDEVCRSLGQVRIQIEISLNNVITSACNWYLRGLSQNMQQP